MLKFLREQLAKLLEQRQALAAARDAIVAAAEVRGSLTDEDNMAFEARRAEINAVDTQIEEVRGRITAAEDDERRTQAANEAARDAGQTGQRREGGAKVTAEPTQYGQGRRHSYFLDLARDQLGRGDGDGGVQEARSRLRRHAQELDVEMPLREARRAKNAERGLDRIEGLSGEQRRSVFERGTAGMEKRVNPGRADGQGGYFVPPLWLIDEYINLPRFGRNTADRCQNFELPPGTDSVNLPKVSTGTSVGVQPVDGGPVPSQDMTDTFVTAPVRTLAGQEDIAMQLLDQSPISFDEVVYADLQVDYSAKLDIQVINGSGINGQHLGILNIGGSVNSVTYTNAGPTLPTMYPAFSQGASLVYKNRKLPATAAVVYPSTWYWATAQLDSTNRPLIVPPQLGLNPAGTQSDMADGTSPVGMLSMGLPAYIDGNLPTTLGAGTNETRVLIARWSDLYLWEGAMRTRVLQEVLSGTMQIRFQIFCYSAFMPNRRPEAVSILSGTGFIPQASY